MVENMMEHIATTVGKDPLEIRLLNMDPTHKTMLQPLIDELMKITDYEMRKRAVEVFNNVRRFFHFN